MGVGSTRHRYGVAVILEPICRFIDDWFTYRFLLHSPRKSTTLNHEAVNNAMENCSVVVIMVILRVYFLSVSNFAERIIAGVMGTF